MAVLLETPAVEYTLAELDEETGVPRGSIRPTLNRLEAADLVCYKEPYWAAAEDDRIATVTAAFVGVETAASTHHGDWYARNAGWEENLPGLSDDPE